MRLHFLKLCFLLVGVLVPLTLWAQSFPDSSSQFTTEYDRDLQESALRYMNPWIANDWQWWKAQCYQESKLDPNAVSPVGAMGLSQVMPRTWQEQAGIMKINASPWNPRANSLVGAGYMGRQLGSWSEPMSYIERIRWAQGSYNFGPGSMRRVYKRTQGTREWNEVELYLPHETKQYVRRIDRWHQIMRDEEFE